MNTAMLSSGVNTVRRASNLTHTTTGPRTNFHNPIFDEYSDMNFTGMFPVVLYDGSSSILVLGSVWSSCGSCACPPSM